MYAGRSNTSGGYNSFVGTQAGYSNVEGGYNSFFGSGAGFTNYSGSNNSFLGLNAGYSNYTGYGNSGLGANAGYRNQTGSGNSFFGTNAGYSNISGSNNTVIGVDADVSGPDLSYATAIGSGARVRTSNTIVLGRSDDKVSIPGLGSAGSTQLCRNDTTFEISTCGSSRRYKTNVNYFSSGLDVLQRLKPIRFEWKDGGMKDVGFGAEDVAAVEPLLATYNDKGEVEGVKYDRIATVLVNAVKEQQAQIEAQRQQLKEQQAQLKQQQTVIEGLKKLLCGQNPQAEVCKR